MVRMGGLNLQEVGGAAVMLEVGVPALQIEFGWFDLVWFVELVAAKQLLAGRGLCRQQE